ncbi:MULTISPECIES: ParB/RepB/Spo0J family partition protein [Streptomyces]|uniref:ParB/RepB/Spo0J family partition protein n=1 Tax=Streptomyces TaxID=1883 RepID=UPI0028DBBAEC|nr:ParB/RepB/Spo0J family partition protein [Streptomyces sp. DSM 40976]
MSERRRGLGRGLGSLIPSAPQERQTPMVGVGAGTSTAGAGPALSSERGVAAAKLASLPHSSPSPDASGSWSEAETVTTPEPPAGAYFTELPLDAIVPNRHQPREIFDEDALAELVVSIKEVGLLQPVVVRKVADERYELVMGERRLRASKEAGLELIPAIVRDTDDEKMLLDALLENLHRAQLNAIEEAHAYEQLLKDFGCTHDQLADRIGRSRPQISNTLRLLRLSHPVQRRVAAGVLSAGHARALLGVEDAEAQDQLAYRIVAEGLSVRTVEEIVSLMGSEEPAAVKPKGPRAGGRVSPALTDLATRLSDRFETRVKVDLGQKKGKIVVEFASMDDLDRILSTLAPGEGKVMDHNNAAQGEQG